MIPVKIKTTGAVMLTDEIRTHVEAKIEKLSKLLDPKDTTALAEVELSSTGGGSRTGEAFRAEINLIFAGGFMRAESSKETLHAAFDEAVEEARRELRHTRTKHRDLIRRGAAKVKDFFRRFTNPRD